MQGGSDILSDFSRKSRLREEDVLGEMIDAIAEPDFLHRQARAICAYAGFDVATVMRHRANEMLHVLYQGFHKSGTHKGLLAYSRHTYRLNPLIGEYKDRVVRARDCRPSLVPDHDAIVVDNGEELGFRTLGWPKRQEELSLQFRSGEALIEFGIYRSLGKVRADGDTVSGLGRLLNPLSAAFAKHEKLSIKPRAVPSPAPLSPLTSREREVAELVLAGCNTEAIARRLCIGVYTVKDHRKSIYRKLGISSLQELFARSACPSLEG